MPSQHTPDTVMYNMYKGVKVMTFLGHRFHMLKLLGEVLWEEALPYIQSLPITIPAGLAAFSAVAMLLLVWNRFYTWPVWVFGLIAAIAAMHFAHHLSQKVTRPGKHSEQVWFDVLAVVGVLVWLLVSVPFTSQRIFTDRDPATYGVTAVWLIHHTNLHIPKLAAFDDLPQIIPGSGAGFGEDAHLSHTVYSQGSHLLPALLGIVGRVVGDRAIFHLNVVFGAIALLAVYGFARLVIKPRWATLVVASLSVSLPLLYLSRNMYTEPLTMIFVFSGLAFLWYARKKSGFEAWTLAGVCLGSMALSRIDTYLPVAAVEVYAIIQLILAKRSERLALLQKISIAAAIVASLGIVAWVDLSQLSSGYYDHLHGQYMAEIYLVIALALTGTASIGLAWRTRMWLWIKNMTKSWRSSAVIIAVAALFVFLLIKPLRYADVIFAANGIIPPTPGYPYAGYEVFSLYWVLWYLPVLTVLAWIALAWIWIMLLKGRYLETLAFTLVVTAESVFYFIHPTISTDQVWATRRFLPIVFPGFAILGGMLLERLYDKRKAVIHKQTINLQILVASLGTLAIASPLFVSNPFLFTRDYVPQVGQIETMCGNLPRNAVVVWVGGATNTMIEPTQAFCDVPSFGLLTQSSDKLTKTLVQLADTGKANSKVIVIAENGNAIPAFSDVFMSVSTITFSDIKPTYSTFPRSRATYTQTIKLAKLTNDGNIVPLTGK